MSDQKAPAKNRNAQRSIRLLKQAFMELLAEKPYEKISVSDVTRRADLNRGTFYAHFDNMDDLLRFVMNELMHTISVIIDRTFDGTFLDNPMPVLEQIGDFLMDNAELARKLVSSTSVEPFINTLERAFRDKARRRLAQMPNVDLAYSQLMADYLASGILGAYRAWLSGEYGAATIGQVNEYLCRLVKATGKAMG